MSEKQSLSNQAKDWTREQLLPALEALLFVACEPLSAAQLAQLLQAEESLVQQAMEQLALSYMGHGFCLQRLAGGWQFATPEQYAPLVEKLYRPKYQQLSQAAMETLSVIAYKQPITRAEISDIRQVDSESVINTLLEKGLIVEAGRLAGAGRAILYGTGPDFLAFFGLDSLDDLPALPADVELAAALPAEAGAAPDEAGAGSKAGT